MRLKELTPSDYHIYVDMDGVVANLVKKMKELTGHTLRDDDKYDNHAWDKFHVKLGAGERLFVDFDPMPDAHELWNYVKKYSPSILTATGNRFPAEVAEQKREWVAKHLAGASEVHVVRASRQKAKVAWPDAILIDDRMKSIGPWREAGGIGILHTSAAETIKELKKLGL